MNTKLISLDDDQIRQSAIQVFQEVAEPARAAREETEETKEEESKADAEDVNFARYAVLRSDALCLRQTEYKQAMLTSADLANTWDIKKFTFPDINLLEACMQNQTDFYKIKENIASKVVMQFVRLHSKVSKVLRKELDAHRFSEPKPLEEEFFTSVLQIFQEEFHRQKE